MLSREDIILTELLVSRGVASREAVERCARIKEISPAPVSLFDALVDSGDVDRTRASSIAEEARSLHLALEPSLPGSGNLGEFRLVREIGRGGMGVVYEAVQEPLGRRVALKVLPAGAALDERLQTRFLLESRAASRLDHPGIVRILTSGLAEGVFYFAMELIEGHSLADEVAGGPVPPERAARIVAQVARAVEHAHEAGLVHRDIKPENVLVGPDDQPRLTDFGLVHELVAGSLTLSIHVLGTPAYIPLEQALGEPVDSRSDVYSLGAVLYSLLCGRPPYASAVPSVVLARVLGGGPAPLLTLRPEVPAGLADICGKAMARHPEGRYARAVELAEDLERFVRGDEVTAAATIDSPRAVDTEPPAHRRSLSRPPTLWLVALSVLVLAIAGVLTWRSRTSEPQAPRPSAHVSFGPTFQLVNRSTGRKLCPALSRDGTELAYVSGQEDTGSDVYLQKLADGSVVALKPSNTERRLGGWPSFSPNGRSLAVMVPCPELRSCLGILDLGDRTLRTLPVPPGASSWSPDGRNIVIADNGAAPTPGSRTPLLTVDVATGFHRTIRSAGLSTPSYSPHGRRIAFASLGGGQFDLWTIAPGGGDMVRVTDDFELDWNPVWSADGTLLYFGSERGGRQGLWKVAVNEETGGPMGLPEPVSDAVFAAPFSLALSADGRTMVVVPKAETGLLVRLDLESDALGLASPPTVFPRFPAATFSPSPSPDGRLLAVSVRSRNEDIAVLPSDGTTEPRFLTDDAYRDGNPRWSPDGALIAFDSDRSGKMEIWTIRPDGSDLSQVTHTQGGGALSPVWSPDGTRIAYRVEGEGSFVTRLDGGSKRSSPEPLTRPLSEEPDFVPSSWSPDGTTLAGSMKGIVLYSIAEGRYRRLTSFGEKPVWLPDGRRLLFTDDRKVQLVSAATGAVSVVYSAEPNDLPSAIAVSPDGRAIYANLSSSGEEIWLARIGE